MNLRYTIVLVWISMFFAFPVAAEDPKAEAPDTQDAARQDDGEETLFATEPQLRPCCAFGHSMRTAVGNSEVLVLINNVLQPEYLGQHSYYKQDLTPELNGLIYTCRGGFMDVAHLRDNADRTAYLYVRIRRVLGSGAIITLSDEGATRQVWLRPFESDLDESQRNELALLLSQRIAFDLSVWHEVATWYGYESVPGFSERLSGFSPEDLYSNIVGTFIGAEALRSGADYNAAVTAEIANTLQDLIPLPPGQTKRTLDMVDGIWWDSRKLLPDNRMVTRRNMDIGETMMPWLVPDAYSPYCSGRPEGPLPQYLPAIGPGGIDLRELYEIRYAVDRSVMPTFPLPDVSRDYVSNRDIPAVIKHVRREIIAMFGPYGDKPGVDLMDMGINPRGTPGYDPAWPCGREDPSCSITRQQEVHGLRIGKLFVGGGNMAGPAFGFTLADVTGFGGGFRFFDFGMAVDTRSNEYTLQFKAIATNDVMFFCSVLAEDGSGRTEVDYPFVDPFSAKCTPGSYFGIKLNLLEGFFSSVNNQKNLRPVDLAFVWDALANGHSLDYLHRHLLFNVGFSVDTIDSNTFEHNTVTVYSSMIWQSMHDDERWGVRVFTQIRDDLRATSDFAAEAGIRVSYNLLWNRRDFRSDSPLHSIITFALELGGSYWYNPKKRMPGMVKIYIPPQWDFIPLDDELGVQAMFYIETTIPKLGLF